MVFYCVCTSCSSTELASFSGHWVNIYKVCVCVCWFVGLSGLNNGTPACFKKHLLGLNVFISSSIDAINVQLTSTTSISWWLFCITIRPHWELIIIIRLSLRPYICDLSLLSYTVFHESHFKEKLDTVTEAIFVYVLIILDTTIHLVVNCIQEWLMLRKQQIVYVGACVFIGVQPISL